MRNDEELMVEYAAGHTEVLDEIFTRYKKRMFNYAFRLLQNQADAEDVVAELFCMLSGKKDAYEPTHKFSTWFYTVAHNICMSKLRMRKRTIGMWFQREKESGELKQWDVPDRAPSPAEAVQTRDTASYIKQAVEKLGFLEKEALILREYQKLRYDEIAAILGFTGAKIKIILYRARQKLKKQLQRLIAEADNV